jgi:hypothetical protein
MADTTSRRGFLSKGVLGAAGVGAALSREEGILLAALNEGANEVEKSKPSVDPKAMPRGKIGKVSISRLFLGGNLIGGWAHSRDLLYVSRLFKAYNTEAKIFETLALAEQCGINTVLIDPVSQRVVEDYKRRRDGKIQTLVCIHPDKDANRVRDEVKRLVDNGATMLYTHGEVTDHLTMNGQADVLGKAVELMKEQGVPAGIGSHSLETPNASEKHGLGPDFYVKTFHNDRYWSASPKESREEWCWYKPQSSDMPGFHDNIWCLDAEKTAATMATIAKPWIAFKVMAAGAIQPRPAFGYAFRNGADFVVAGMFDFQIEEDVKIALDVLRKVDSRSRPWRA